MSAAEWFLAAIGLYGAVKLATSDLGRGLLARLQNASQGKPGASTAEPFTPSGDECRRDGAIERPGTKAFRDYVLKRFGGLNLGILGDAAHQKGCSGHNTGRSWDWGTVKGAYKNNPTADTTGLLAWLSANNWEMARRCGIGYLIFNRRIWSAKTMLDNSGDKGWLPYKGADAHDTHIHFTFNDAGAEGKTSAYTEGMLK